VGLTKINRLTAVLSSTFGAILLILVTGIAQAYAGAYTIDSSGGSCSQIGAWDNYALSCTMSADLTVGGSGIDLAGDGISLNGGGYSLIGTGADGDVWTSGVSSEGRSDVSISNLNISGFTYGVNLKSTTDSTITGTTVTDSNIGIGTFDSNNNTITGNQADQNRLGILLTRSTDSLVTGNSTEANREVGIELLDSQGITVSGNQSNGNGFGIYLNGSDSNDIRNNQLQQNYRGLIVGGNNNDVSDNQLLNNTYYGIDLAGNNNYLTGNVVNGSKYDFRMNHDYYGTLSGNIISTTNLFDGKLFYSFRNLSNAVIDASAFPDTYAIYCDHCTDVVIRGFSINGAYDGIVISGGRDVSVKNARLLGNMNGIKAISSLVTISDSEIVGGDEFDNVGIFIINTEPSRIENNLISGTRRGIMLLNYYSGQDESSAPIVIWGNDIFSNAIGIDLSTSSGNTIAYNNIVENFTGITMDYQAANNIIYRNHFARNDWHIDVSCNYKGCGLGGPPSADNIFSLPDPEGGNYWDDWTGYDANGDGFLDNPRMTRAGVDLLPLALNPIPSEPENMNDIDSDAPSVDNGLVDNDLQASDQPLTSRALLPATGLDSIWLTCASFMLAAGIWLVRKRMSSHR